MTTTQLFRVVGVYPDGSRRLICGRIETRDEGEEVANALRDVSPFASLVVEPDEGSMLQRADPGDTGIEDGKLPVIGGPWDGARWQIGPTRVEKRCNRVVLEFYGKRIDASTAQGRDAIRRLRDARADSIYVVYRLAIRDGKECYAFSGFEKD
jgi:hypothetical protein